MTADDLRAVARQRKIQVTMAGMIREFDAAAMLGVGARTLRRWRAQGTAPAHVTIGKTTVLYPLASLAAALTPNNWPTLAIRGQTRPFSSVPLVAADDPSAQDSSQVQNVEGGIIAE